MLVTFGICFKQHFDIRYLVFYNPSPPRMFLCLDLLSQYRIQHGVIGPLYATSIATQLRYSAGKFQDLQLINCPCDVWCRGLTTCLLHVGPPFGNRFLNTRWAVYLHFWVFWHMQLYLSWYIISFLALSLLLEYSFSYCFKYSCPKIFHRRSLCTFYWLSVQLEFSVTNLTVTSQFATRVLYQGETIRSHDPKMCTCNNAVTEDSFGTNLSI